MSRPPNAPKGLKTQGRALWRQIAGAYELRPDETAVLEQACRTRDLIFDLEEAIEAGGLMGVGSKGQPVASPLLTELGRARALLARLLNQIDVPDGDPARQQAKEAAQARWGRRKQTNDRRRGGAA